MKNLIFLAPPAAGKGTQAQLLVDKYAYTQISVGDLLREEVEKGNEELNNIMTAGKLVDTKIIVKLLLKKFNDENCNYILDGFPRSLEQAEALEQISKLENIDLGLVIYLHISKEEAKNRIVGRRTCPKCNRIYNCYIEDLKPIECNICDDCKVELTHRDDDNDESFERRYNTYYNETTPLINYYKNKNVLYEIDASVHTDEIFKKIEEIINDKN